MFPTTIVAGLLLLVSGFSPSVKPSYIESIALLGLAFPYLYLTNVVLLIYWGVQLRLKSIFPLAILLINVNGISLYLQWNTSNKEVKTHDINVVTYNANLFGYYDEKWHVDSICNIIKSTSADIVLLQEIYNKHGNLERMRRYLQKQLKLNYGAVSKLSNNREYGMCILSRYPIKNWDKIHFGRNTGNMSMYADVELADQKSENQRTIRVYNIHLQSVRFDKTDYQSMETILSDEPGESNTEGIITKLKSAYSKRSPQVQALKKELESCKLTKIVGGDFNDVPMSYTYHELSEDLKDAFTQRGSGLETTYKGLFPSFRIDYLLYSDAMDCQSYRSYAEMPGDHKMISTRLNTASLFK
mgnify:FL=1